MNKKVKMLEELRGEHSVRISTLFGKEKPASSQSSGKQCLKQATLSYQSPSLLSQSLALSIDWLKPSLQSVLEAPLAPPHFVESVRRELRCFISPGVHRGSEDGFPLFS